MTTTTSEKAAGAAASAQQIADEHRALGESVDRLEQTTDPHQLLPRLVKLRDQLQHHFEGEEASDGIREDVGRLAPFLMGSLEGIFDEHRQFLEEIEALRAKTQACVEGPLAEILHDVMGLIRRLRDHEARESELFSDVYYNDYGEGAD